MNTSTFANAIAKCDYGNHEGNNDGSSNKWWRERVKVCGFPFEFLTNLTEHYVLGCILDKWATKHHFFLPKMVIHKSRRGSRSSSNPPRPHGNSFRFPPILIRRSSHLSLASKLTKLCEYASILVILTTLRQPSLLSIISLKVALIVS